MRALLVVLAIASTASAQNVVGARLQQLAQQKVAGAAPVGAVFGGLLNQKQSASQPAALLGGRCYTLIGTGGDGVKDVDLYIYDGANKKVASDLGFDAVPALTYCPTWPGQHRVEIVVKSGGGEVAAQLYVQPLASAPALAPAPAANSAPDAMTAMIEQSARANAAAATRMGDFYRGMGKDNEHGDYTVPLDAAHCYTFIGVGNNGMRSLSLYLWDPGNHRVADQKGQGTMPIINYCAQVSGPFHVQAKVQGGLGEWRLAVYAYPPQAEQVTVAAAPAGDPLDALVESQAKSVAPGYARTGEIFRGTGAKSSHTDWTVPLENGRCYTFVGVGGAGVEMLSLYAWDPTGKRVADRRSNNSQSVMGVCASMPGPYHLQGKIEKGQGEYRMGVYVK